jgi:hypothetical protein
MFKKLFHREKTSTLEIPPQPQPPSYDQTEFDRCVDDIATHFHQLTIPTQNQWLDLNTPIKNIEELR